MAWPVVAAMAAGTAAQLYSSYKQSQAQKEACTCPQARTSTQT